MSIIIEKPDCLVAFKISGVMDMNMQVLFRVEL